MYQFVRRIYLALAEAFSLTQGVFPTSADGVSAAATALTAAAVAWTWGAWAQIVAGTGVTTDVQISGFVLDNFVGANAQGEVQIGTGAGGSEVAIAVSPLVTQYTFPKPLGVRAGTRIAARFRTATGVADTCTIKITTLVGA